jgi:hypothetical protein
MMMILVASVAVALVAFIIYALERKSKGQPISWEHAGKLSLFGGLITAGVVFSTGAEGIPDLTKNLPSVESVQEMFVGTPSF